MIYTEEYLKKLKILTLREIGIELGVKAPTSLTKAKLIEAILKVSNGQTEPYRSNKGRPANKITIGVMSSLFATEENANEAITRINQKIEELTDKFKTELTEFINGTLRKY